jgi:hypothetical protein
LRPKIVRELEGARFHARVGKRVKTIRKFAHLARYDLARTVGRTIPQNFSEEQKEGAGGLHFGNVYNSFERGKLRCVFGLVGEQPNAQ